jgi:hypothetical protein
MVRRKSEMLTIPADAARKVTAAPACGIITVEWKDVVIRICWAGSADEATLAKAATNNAMITARLVKRIIISLHCRTSSVIVKKS